MSLQIDDIVEQLRDKYYERDNPETWWATKLELERIIDSQFKVLQLHIEAKETKDISLIYLGKFKASLWFKHNKEMLYARKLEKQIHRNS